MVHSYLIAIFLLKTRLLTANVLIRRACRCDDMKILSNHWNHEIKAPFKKIIAWDVLFFALGIGVGIGIGAGIGVYVTVP